MPDEPRPEDGLAVASFRGHVMLSDPDAPASGEGWFFAAAFRTSRRALVVTDPRRPDNPIVFVNAACERLTGYAPAEMIGRNPNFLQGAGTEADAIARLREAVAAGEGIEIDLLNYRKDGTPFWNAMAIDPVRDEAGAVAYYVAIQEDATHRRANEAALAGARDVLEAEITRRTHDLKAALDQQTALLHEVDHRVKNNLQVISSLILLKARRMSEASTRAVLNSVADRIGALSTAHRLLYASGDVSRFDLAAFASDFAADLAAIVDARRIAVTLDVDPIEVGAAKAAPLALLVHELATNAARHAFPDERCGTVAIAAKRGGDGLTLTVSDDGIGLGASRPNPDGFGRSLVEMMVRQMRGEVAFEDAAPGTHARARIPLDAAGAL